MVSEWITIHGARTHNLKNVDVKIPRDKFVVMTGLSGSGKSSLAFDTLYAEGQRRYVESLSSYARQFLGQADKPDVDSIDGLSPAISIDQKTTSKNPRSTVGTVTEINDYYRLLYARVGQPDAPADGTIIKPSIDQMLNVLNDELAEGSKLQILAPVIRHKRGSHASIFERIQKEGYIRILVDGEMHDVSDDLKLDKNKYHDISIVVDRIVLRESSRTRLFESFEASLKLADGVVGVAVVDGLTLQFSDHYTGALKEFGVGKLSPALFSFNAPMGACEICGGLGVKVEVDLDLVVPDQTLTLEQGAIAAWNPISSKYYPEMLRQFAEQYDIPMDVPYRDLTNQQKELVLSGAGEKTFHFHYQNDFGGVRDIDTEFEGVINNINRRYKESSSDFTREVMRQYMTALPCNACHGYRLNPGALSVKINGKHIGQVSELPIDEELAFFEKVDFGEQDAEIARPILKEIKDRLSFLKNVGLDYLTLSRSARTLSGGEAQRIRLATQIGSNLSGVMYVLDEPSIGLHQRDNNRLIASLNQMRDLGNTLIVVEHDEDTMLAADYLIDVGPGAGEHGGEIMAYGTPDEVRHNPNSLTGKYLNGEKFIPVPKMRRSGNGKFLTVKGATENNLKNIDVDIPLGTFTTVTGVSGSGKSSLVNAVLKKALKREINRNTEKPGAYKELIGWEQLDKIVDIDQSPIGRTPRSNPATYTGVFDDIRELFAQTNEAKMRGYKKGRFSFNTKGGRCEACKGDGVIKIEMNFLPDVYVNCEVCGGTRFNSETLEVTYRGLNIAEVLDLTAEQALDFFNAIPKIRRKLQTIVDVGLGYVQLGQAATTLSGGEAQRMKLASELQRRSTGKTIYILDEPTTGLHVDDISRLLAVLQRLVDSGNTVLVIEHNLDVIKTADWVIDLGPEGGQGGGKILVAGTPEKIAKTKKSYTGQYLGPLMKRDLKRAQQTDK
ncbi:excinuclease ABC subunit UvrA [Weissella kandleri]|uniref:excinuclease ABC subunit UvrA n=1 Tax=Weissella kandleri TaxID=1616 RepID=UPI000709B8B3|nr:excinuclease ABC subunit UvrA [Weissella kandleri]